MGLFVEQNSNRSKLQEKLAAELNEKHRRKSSTEGGGASGGQNAPDGVDDSAYMENTKQTTSLAWVWMIVIVVAIAIATWLVFLSVNG